MKRPVFVVGAPRSGTTLLHHMLLSAGGFVLYGTETHAFNLLQYRFGNLQRQRNRKRMLDAWLKSRNLRPRNLDTADLERRVLAECRSGGDFLRILMEHVATRQNVKRWVEHTPDHLLFIPEIKRYFPDALIVHVIRDGRDVALSLAKKGWIRAAGQLSDSDVTAAAMYWYWTVRRGRSYGEGIPSDYTEVRYESLVQEPEAVLGRLRDFLGHDLNYSTIKEAAIGTIRNPYSSFADRPGEGNTLSIGRWRRMLNGDSIARLELLIGDLLQDLGYPTESRENSTGVHRLPARASLWWHFCYFDAKLWIKKTFPLLSALPGAVQADHRFSA